jgi:hypothetical protein
MEEINMDIRTGIPRIGVTKQPNEARRIKESKVHERAIFRAENPISQLCYNGSFKDLTFINPCLPPLLRPFPFYFACSPFYSFVFPPIHYVIEQAL